MTDSDDNKAASRYALASGVLALALWSGTAIANKVAVGYMSGLTAGVLRSMVAGFFAVIIVVVWRLPRPSSLRDVTLLLTSGLASFAIWPTLISIGIERTTASHAAIAMAIIPVLTVLIAHIVHLRLPGRRWWLGSSIAFIATALLVGQQEETSTGEASGATVVGDLIVLTGGAICAIGYVAGGKLSSKIGSMATTFWGLASALILLVPLFVFAAPKTAWTDLPIQAWVAIAWMAILSSLIGYGLWFFALSAGGIAKIGSLQLGMPVVTIVAASVLLGESITVEIALITVAIVVGTWWAHRYAS